MREASSARACRCGQSIAKTRAMLPEPRTRTPETAARSPQKAPDQNSTTLNSALLTSHNGHRQSSGISENRVPGAMPSSGKPVASSYTHPQIRQTQLLCSITSLTALRSFHTRNQKTTTSSARTRRVHGHTGAKSANHRPRRTQPAIVPKLRLTRRAAGGAASPRYN